MRIKRRRRRADQLQLPGLMSQKHQSLAGERMPRRGFLARALGWVTISIGAVLGVPGITAIVSPALKKSARQWSPIARLTARVSGEPDLTKLNVPILTHFRALVGDAYMSVQPKDVPVYVVNHGKGRFTVFDVRCTHLGCPVKWDPAKKEFLSPCHGGVFDAEGLVLAGPPPRPLDRYEFKVEGDVLFAGRLFQVNDDLERVTT